MELPPIAVRPSRAGAARLLAEAALPFADLTDELLDHFFYAGDADAPEGLVGLEFGGDEAALIRSLAVVPGQRGRGLGAALVAHAEADARGRGVTALYLLTTTAEAFFLRLGYVPVPRNDVPASIQAMREFTGMCPSTAACLTRRLTG